MRSLLAAASLLGAPLLALYLAQQGDQIGAVYASVWFFAGTICYAIKEDEERMRVLFALSIVAGAIVLVLAQQDSIANELKALADSHAARHGVR